MNNQQVTVMDINMTFGSMVVFMIKWAFASVFAALLVGITVGITILILGIVTGQIHF
jgi:hypothetical protein